MAQGDIIVYDQFLVDVQEGEHNLETDVIKLALVDSTESPAATDSDPRYGAGGGTNLTTNAVAAGGNYAAGGPTIGNNGVSLSGGAGVFDGDDISISQDGSNPTDARDAPIYNDTNAGKRAIGWLDLGSVTDLSAGDFSITWNVGGIHSFNQA